MDVKKTSGITKSDSTANVDLIGVDRTTAQPRTVTVDAEKFAAGAHAHDVATPTSDGFMAAQDKVTLTTLAAATPPVTSVHGRTGEVAAVVGDYSASKIANDGTAPGSTVADALTALDGGKADEARRIDTAGSLTGGGTLALDRSLSLIGDQEAPGPDKVYGTDGAGAKGWRSPPAGGGGGGGGVWGTITGLIGDQGDLATELAGKAPLAHTHDYADAGRQIETVGMLNGGGDLTADLTIALAGDTGDTVSADHYYGTNGAGLAGFFPLPAVGGGGIDGVDDVLTRPGETFAAKTHSATGSLKPLWSDGSRQRVTLAANVVSLDRPDPVAGAVAGVAYAIVIDLVQDATGGRSVVINTAPGSGGFTVIGVTPAVGIAPGEVTTIVIETFDGGVSWVLYGTTMASNIGFDGSVASVAETAVQTALTRALNATMTVGAGLTGSFSVKGQGTVAVGFAGTGAAGTAARSDHNHDTTYAARSITVTGATSINGGGDLTANRSLSLVGDSSAPGASKYYGTDASGAKGFFAVGSSGSGVVGVIETGALSYTNATITPTAIKGGGFSIDSASWPSVGSSVTLEIAGAFASGATTSRTIKADLTIGGQSAGTVTSGASGSNSSKPYRIVIIIERTAGGLAGTATCYVNGLTTGNSAAFDLTLTVTGTIVVNVNGYLGNIVGAGYQMTATSYSIDKTMAATTGTGSGQRVAANMAALRAINPDASPALTNGELCYLRGYATDGDGGEGYFIWSATTDATDDSGAIIRPAINPTAGRWLRQRDAMPVNVRWFGAGRGGDDTTAIDHADDLCQYYGDTLYFPPGIYTCTFTPGYAQRWVGNGATVKGLITFSGLSAVDITGITFVSTDMGFAPTGGISAINCDKVTVRDCVFQRSILDIKASGANWTDNVLIEGNRFEGDYSSYNFSYRPNLAGGNNAGQFGETGLGDFAITAITRTGTNAFRLTFETSPGDLSDLTVGRVIYISGATNALHNGAYAITALDNVAKTVDYTNPNIDASELASPAIVQLRGAPEVIYIAGARNVRIVHNAFDLRSPYRIMKITDNIDYDPAAIPDDYISEDVIIASNTFRIDFTCSKQFLDLFAGCRNFVFNGNVVDLYAGWCNEIIEMKIGKDDGNIGPLDVSNIAWQSGTTVRYSFSGSPNLSAVLAGDFVIIGPGAKQEHCGRFAVTAVSDASDWIEVSNPLVTSGDINVTGDAVAFATVERNNRGVEVANLKGGNLAITGNVFRGRFLYALFFHGAWGTKAESLYYPQAVVFSDNIVECHVHQDDMRGFLTGTGDPILVNTLGAQSLVVSGNTLTYRDYYPTPDKAYEAITCGPCRDVVIANNVVNVGRISVIFTSGTTSTYTKRNERTVFLGNIIQDCVQYAPFYLNLPSATAGYYAFLGNMVNKRNAVAGNDFGKLVFLNGTCTVTKMLFSGNAITHANGANDIYKMGTFTITSLVNPDGLSIN